MSAPLRLLAREADEIPILSAALQDAVTHARELGWDRRARTVTVRFNRFRWEGGGDRVRAALQLGGVLAVKSRGMPRSGQAVLNLLALTFIAGDAPESAPGGSIDMIFAGGAEVRVEVECVDAVLADVSLPWMARRRPSHEGTGA